MNSRGVAAELSPRQENFLPIANPLWARAEHFGGGTPRSRLFRVPLTHTVDGLQTSSSSLHEY